MQSNPVIQDERRERTYAGVLGKIIGVYLGRPVEMWPRRRIESTFGEVKGYLSEKLGLPLIVADDDISGTFVFIRATRGLVRLEDLTPKKVAAVWLNELIEDRTTLWWGGFGNSTEHTAYKRLQAGCTAPRSGSSQENGPVVANQIGGQIFADGWSMLSPGDPVAAACAARRAASVSHDDDALDAAAAVAAMQSAAFLGPGIEALFEIAADVIRPDGLIRRIHDDVQRWRAGGLDWRTAMDQIEQVYSLTAFPGNCHVAPNHAIFCASVLYGAGDFGASVRLAVQAGMDTDSNAGNVGCLLGILNGLAGLSDGFDWRGPVADRMLVVSADGASAFTDALSVADGIGQEARRLKAEPPLASGPLKTFAFDAPGSIQGFRHLPQGALPGASVAICNPSADGLVLGWCEPVENAYVGTQTFIRPGDVEYGPYEVHASPSVYPGQRISALLAEPQHGINVRIAAEYAMSHGTHVELGPVIGVSPEAATAWTLPDIETGAPICSIGVVVSAPASGAVKLVRLWVEGGPEFTWTPDIRNPLKGRSWVATSEHFFGGTRDGYLRVSHGSGLGLAMIGARAWKRYSVAAQLRSHLSSSFGLVVGGQGVRRLISIRLASGRKLTVTRWHDGRSATLAECSIDFDPSAWICLAAAPYDKQLIVNCEGTALELKIQAEDAIGTVGVCCSEGTVDLRHMQISKHPMISADLAP
ncbi:MAG: ADP-ribosylglycohydrolase family protein [Hyphomonas sp.]|jgi:ADP-ribosylglycohydrolase|nr:ADP-ribosylglycohydrolase family protein [Hyphomonas sp.]